MYFQFQALLGAQLVITLVMVSVIQKIGSHYSFARWLLCSTGLFRYLYPTDDELRTLAGVPKEKGKSKKSTKGSEPNGKVETFHVSRSLDIQLDTAKVSPLDVIHLRYYAEYQWLVDFALYSAVVYSLTEVSIDIKFIFLYFSSFIIIVFFLGLYQFLSSEG